MQIALTTVCLAVIVECLSLNNSTFDYKYHFNISLTLFLIDLLITLLIDNFMLTCDERETLGLQEMFARDC